MSGSIDTNPSENINWRRHKNACPFYRERWFPCSEAAGEPMYQVFCLKGTPPVTYEDQERCFRSKSACWRLTQKQTMETPEEESESTTHTGTKERSRRAS